MTDFQWKLSQMSLDQVIQVARDVMEEIEDRGGGMILDIASAEGRAPTWMKCGTLAQTRDPRFQRAEFKQEIAE